MKSRRVESWGSPAKQETLRQLYQSLSVIGQPVVTTFIIFSYFFDGWAETIKEPFAVQHAPGAEGLNFLSGGLVESF